MRRFLQLRITQSIIIGMIVLDSVVLGILTFSAFKQNPILLGIDEICLYFFIFEMCIKILVFRKDFFASKWNLFDLVVIVLSTLPLANVGNIIVLRFLKVTRFFSTIPQLQFIIAVISKSIPNVVCIGVLLLLVYYIYAVLGTQLFAEATPDYFGDLGKSFFTLFQIMTGESWSEAIARPIMQTYPYSWVYFISFIIIVSFIVLNMIIGVIVDSINEIKTQK